MKTFLVAVVLVSLSILGCTSHTTFIDITPPAAPRGVEIFAGGELIEVFWIDNTERDLAGYNVYVSLNPQGNFKLIGSTRTAQFVDQGVENGRTYYYAVAAFDFDGNESNLS
ncbi:MAG: hypothetical protein AABZ61_09210, partial [Bacteroidota bacterium]